MPRNSRSAGVAIAIAGSNDICDLVALLQRAYRGDGARKGWTHEADLLGGQRTDPAELAAIIGDSRQQMLVLRGEGEIIGCIAVTAKGGGLAYIGMVTVDPERQASGYGRILLKAAEAYARDKFGCGRAEMTVIGLRSELIAWYERRGYAATGEMRPFPVTDPRIGVLTSADLDFIVLEKALRP